MCRKCNTERVGKYAKTDNGRKHINEAVYRSTARYPEKQLARQKLRYYVQKGVVKKPVRCQKCHKREKLFGHHESYFLALKVKWLCRNCHCLEHKKRV